MSRPKNTKETIKITLSASPKFAAYLDDLVLEEGYGKSRAEVARTLVWRSIEELMHKGIIMRRSSSETRRGNNE